MGRLDEFLHEHRVAGCGHWESHGHDPLVRALHKVYRAWCEKNEYLVLSEDKFVPLVIDAGYEKYRTAEGQRFKGLTLDTAVEHANGAADPEAYWAEQHSAEEAARAVKAEEAAAQAAALKAATERRKASEWWSGTAYDYLAKDYKLPADMERYRAEFFRQERLDAALRKDFADVRALEADRAAGAAYDAKWGGHDRDSDDRDSWHEARTDAWEYARASAFDEWDREQPEAVARMVAAGLPVKGGLADFVDPQLARWQERRRYLIHDQMRVIGQKRHPGAVSKRHGKWSVYALSAMDESALRADAEAAVDATIEPFEHCHGECYFDHR